MIDKYACHRVYSHTCIFKPECQIRMLAIPWRPIHRKTPKSSKVPPLINQLALNLIYNLAIDVYMLMMHI